MVELPKIKHPHVYKEFSTTGGKFTVQKMTNTFSSIPLDQAHEQNNELIKRDCEAIGITETPGALLMDGGWTGAGKIGKRVWEYSRGGQHRPDWHPLPWAIQGLSSGFHKSC